MNYGATTNLIIGAVIALLPLYTRVAKYDLGRVSKDNLLVVIFGVLLFFMPERKRNLSLGLCNILVCGLFFLIVNQYNPASINVMFQIFYISMGMVFFASYYERHDGNHQNYLLNGMAIGCIIQSIIVICNFLDFPVYFIFIDAMFGGVENIGMATNGIGSLGATNHLASYTAITAIAFFRKNWIPFIILPITSLILADSMMGYASLLAGSVYFINQKFNLIKKHALYLGSLVAMVAVYFSGIQGMDSGRFGAWRKMFARVDFGHFVLGRGPGWFADNGVIINDGSLMIQEHNELISAFNIFGIVGIILIGYLFIKFIFQKDINAIFPSILFTGFINSYGHFTLHQSTVAIIIITSAAICLAERDKHVVNMER